MHRPQRETAEQAYLELLELFDADKIPKKTPLQKLLEKEELVRSQEDLRRLVRRSGLTEAQLPDPVKEALRTTLDYVVEYRVLEEQEPSAGPLVDDLSLDPWLKEALKAASMTRLYAFQQEAISRILNGEDVVIVAPTGSGKTEGFAIPLTQRLGSELARFGGLVFGERRVSALIIYPTKALARDQLPKLRRLGEAVGVRFAIFDGDTPPRERQRIIDDPPSVILTNFDILHVHLHRRTAFSRLLRDIKHVIVDEVHVYTGTFGANVHHILKRLQRVSGPFHIAAASATLANPQEFCETLFDRKLSVVQTERGRHGRIHFVMLFPTLRTHRALVIDLIRLLARNGYRTLAFSNSHLGAELTAFYGRRGGVDVQVHRAGLPLDMRKRVEDDFKHGKIQAVAATPTLELGIDIGAVDGVISDLVPVNRLTQRTGRAGRRGQESVAFLALRENDPISQHYRNKSQEYFEDLEAGYVDPHNPVITEVHLLAAAFDKPLSRSEVPPMSEGMHSLLMKGLLEERNGKLYPRASIARKVLDQHDIRGGGDSVIIRHQGRKLGERNMPMALEELHPGAVYFLAGARFRVKDFRFIGRIGEAHVERLPLNYLFYTRALLEEWPTVEHVLMKRRAFETEVAYCDLQIRKRVIGYVNRELGGESLRGERVHLDTPLEYTFRSKGLVFKAPKPSQSITQTPDIRQTDLEASGYHATEHVLIEGTNSVTGGVAQDLGGISLGTSGLIFVYDGSVGGNGASRMLFQRLEKAFKTGDEILSSCRCTSQSGCPRCTYSYRCGNNNEFLNKAAAAETLQRVVAREWTTLERVAEILKREERPFV